MGVKQRIMNKWGQTGSGFISFVILCVRGRTLKILRKKRTGCWINNNYIGILGYADDIFLLSPTRDGLQETCDDYATHHNLTFSTNSDYRKCKTKCLAFQKNTRNLKNIQLGKIELPWVQSTKHLGNKIMTTSNGMEQDVLEERAAYIEERAAYISMDNELLQEFHFAHPSTLVNVNNIYNSHVYGSTLWNLFSKEGKWKNHRMCHNETLTSYTGRRTNIL